MKLQWDLLYIGGSLCFPLSSYCDSVLYGGILLFRVARTDILIVLSVWVTQNLIFQTELASHSFFSKDFSSALTRLLPGLDNRPIFKEKEIGTFPIDLFSEFCCTGGWWKENRLGSHLPFIIHACKMHRDREETEAELCRLCVLERNAA